MPVPAAFFALILIWSTTPLAIHWSSEGPGFLFGVAGRMALSAALCLLLMALRRERLPWDRRSRRAYIAASLGIYGSMLCVYWGAQFIPTGWISVLFGLVPAITAILAALFLQERSFTPAKAAGVVLGLAGLAAIFGHSAGLGRHTLLGVGAVLLSVVLNCISMVWVQRSGEKLSPLAVTSGGLVISVVLYLITWLALDGVWPARLPLRAAWSLIYLAVFGSAIGFMLYYYLLKHLAASKVGLIMLVTPVTSLLMGHLFNGEAVTAAVWWGTALIVAGLAAHQWGDAFWDALLERWPGNGAAAALSEEEER